MLAYPSHSQSHAVPIELAPLARPVHCTSVTRCRRRNIPCAGGFVNQRREHVMMKSKWLAGLGFCALSAGAIALAQEPPAQPPPPPAQGEPVQRPGIRVKAPGVDVQVPRRDEETVDPNAPAQAQQPVTYHRAKQI